MLDKIKQQLSVWQQKHLTRKRKQVSAVSHDEIICDGKRLTDFASSDYLGLATHPDVQQAIVEATARYGHGSCASALVTGYQDLTAQLEQEVADFVGYPRVLVLNSGYMANLSVLSSLLNHKSTVIHDKYNHASLLDGARLAGAKIKRYLHADTSSLQALLTKSAISPDLIVTESVFSMGGDIAPIPKISKLAGAIPLMVDDAHGFGVIGAAGRGCLSHFGLTTTQLPIYVGTFSKALGGHGGFVAGSEEFIEYLIQFARPYMFTTHLPAAVIAGNREALRLLRLGEYSLHLYKNIVYFKQLIAESELAFLPSETAIQPLLVGNAKSAHELAERLMQQGIIVGMMRPPSVPEGQAMLRITLSAAHSRVQLEQLVSTLSTLCSRQQACDDALS